MIRNHRILKETQFDSSQHHNLKKEITEYQRFPFLLGILFSLLFPLSA